MPTFFYSMSWDAAVVIDMIEDPSLTTPMKLTSAGALSVKQQFIEETRSYSMKMALTTLGNFYARNVFEVGTADSPIPPIPAPVGTMSFDIFDYYTPDVFLDILNSGSNEWNNTTPLAAWSARTAYSGIKEWDNFTTYTVSSSLSPSLAGSGSGAWSGVYDYYARYTYKGTKNFDVLDGYTTGTFVSGSAGGLKFDNTPWTPAWNGRSIWYGIKAYDNFSEYTLSLEVHGSGSQPDPRYQSFSSNWSARNVVSASL